MPTYMTDLLPSPTYPYPDDTNLAPQVIRDNIRTSKDMRCDSVKCEDWSSYGDTMDSVRAMKTWDCQHLEEDKYKIIVLTVFVYLLNLCLNCKLPSTITCYGNNQ